MLTQYNCSVLTRDERDYLAKISVYRKVIISPFDLKAKETGNLLVLRISKEFSNLKVLFMGATALGIAGQNDLDIYVLAKSRDFSKHLPKLKQLFGNPKNIHKTFVEWNFTENGYPVELYLTEPPERQIKVHKILKSSEKLLKEYEDLKLKYNGKSFRDYQKAKYEFYHTILN